MAAEAAILGTPNLRVSSWAGRLSVLDEIEQRYGLTQAYRPAQIREALAHLDRWIEQPDLREQFAKNRRRLLEDKVDVAQWFVDFVEAGAPLSPPAQAPRGFAPSIPLAREPQPPSGS
jgi:predicted glycosyltransferase